VVTKATWEAGDVLAAEITREVVCHDGTEEKVARSTLTAYKTQGVVLDIVAGVIGMAAGGIAIAMAPSISDKDETGSDGESKGSPRSAAYGLGALGLGFGVGFAGHGIYIAARGIDDETDIKTGFESSPTGDTRVCGTAAPGAGVVFVEYQGRLSSCWSPRLPPSVSGSETTLPSCAATSGCSTEL